MEEKFFVILLLLTITYTLSRIAHYAEISKRGDLKDKREEKRKQKIAALYGRDNAED